MQFRFGLGFDWHDGTLKTTDHPVVLKGGVDYQFFWVERREIEKEGDEVKVKIVRKRCTDTDVPVFYWRRSHYCSLVPKIEEAVIESVQQHVHSRTRKDDFADEHHLH